MVDSSFWHTLCKWYTNKKYSYRVCDGCGKHSPYANSYNEALDKAKEAGWVHYVDANKDYCPECAKNVSD